MEKPAVRARPAAERFSGKKVFILPEGFHLAWFGLFFSKTNGDARLLRSELV